MWKSVAGTWVAVNNFCTDFSIEVSGCSVAVDRDAERAPIGAGDGLDADEPARGAARGGVGVRVVVVHRVVHHVEECGRDLGCRQQLLYRFFNRGLQGY